MIQSKGVNFA
jgi:hypothetical protein